MKKTKLGQALIGSLTEALAHTKGEVTLRSLRVALPALPPAWSGHQIAGLRSKLRVSQTIFARIMGVSPATLRAWEQGQKNPTGSARRLFQITATNPQALLEVVERRKAG